MALTCANAQPCLCAAGIRADSKQEARLFDALAVLGEHYSPHKRYPHSRVGRACDAYIASRRLWIECYGGNFPPDDAGAKDYYKVMLAKAQHFKSCSTCGRLLIIFRGAIYDKRFNCLLYDSLNSIVPARVSVLGCFSRELTGYFPLRDPHTYT